jgi:hypothetical protein
MKNNIKALFFLKANSKKFANKSIFFSILEIACSNLIENNMKIADKSLRYSYRASDSNLAN